MSHIEGHSPVIFRQDRVVRTVRTVVIVTTLCMPMMYGVVIRAGVGF